jgi:hypothetical protein
MAAVLEHLAQMMAKRDLPMAILALSFRVQALAHAKVRPLPWRLRAGHRRCWQAARLIAQAVDTATLQRQRAIAGYGLGLHRGNPVSQNAQGHVLGHVLGRVCALLPSARMLRRQRQRQRQRQSVPAGRRHIATLMRRMGIAALAPQHGTRKRAPCHKVSPVCGAGVSASRPSRAEARQARPTPTKAGHSGPPSSPTRCWVRAVSSAWTRAALGGARSA